MRTLLTILETLPGMTPRTLRRGEVLFRQGEPGESLYCVRQGRLRALVQGKSGPPAAAGEIGRGEAVGELALLTGSARAATIVALRDTELLECSKDQFDRWIRTKPDTVLELTRLIVTRLQHTLRGDSRTDLPSTIAVIPSGARTPAGPFCQALAGALGRFGPALHLSAAKLPADSREEPELTGWLDQQERAHPRVVYETEARLTPWSSRCLRQADRVLILASPDDAPEPGEVERSFWSSEWDAIRPRAELVLLRNSNPPSGTSRWLDQRPGLFCHHHLDTLRQPEVQALARKVAGCALGLALGGGGARGFGHIGLVRAMRETGLPVDQVGGTSMGAIMAAQVASGWSAEDMLRENRRWFVERGSLKDYVFPSVSLLGGKRFVRLLQGMFGETRIEDLPLNYFCVTCNLTRATVQAQRRGPVWQWVLASISVPGIGPPRIEQGELLVDGGVLNNLPVDLVKEQAAGWVIGSDASPAVDLEMRRSFSGRPYGLRALAHWLNREESRVVPSIFEILLRTAEMSCVYTQKQLARQADLYIKLPVGDLKLFDMHRLEEVAEGCYRHCLPVLCDWLKNTPALAAAVR